LGEVGLGIVLIQTVEHRTKKKTRIMTASILVDLEK